MIRTFAKDAVVYGAATVVTRATSLVIVPVYTRFLSPADYGVLDLLTIAGNLVLLTVALEIAQAVARFLPEATGEDKVRIASSALLFSTGAYAAFGVVAVAATPVLRGWLIGEAADDLTFQLAVVATCLNGIFQLTAGVLRFQLRASSFAVASLTSSLVAIGVGLGLVVVARAEVNGIFIGQIVGGVVGVSLSLISARGLYRLGIETRHLGAMLRFSSPLVPSSVGVFVSLFVDRFAISQFMTISDVGIFGIGYRLASLMSLLSLGAQMAVTPLIYSRHSDPGTPHALERIFRYYVAAALVVGLGVSLFAPEILRILTTPTYYGAAVVVPLLVPALILANLYVFMPGLGIAKRTTTFAGINLSGALLNLILNFLLIPHLGIVGAALATLVSAAVVFGAYAVGSQREYPVRHQWHRLALAVLAVSLVYVVAAQFSLDPLPALLLKALGMSVAVVAAIGALGLRGSGHRHGRH